MELVCFSVSNFRSITKASKLPIKRNTILIGANNEGKSNILRALVVSLEVLKQIGGFRIERGRVRNVGAHYHGSIYERERDFPLALQKDNPTGESVFNIEFRLSEEEVTEFEEEVESTLNGTLPIEIKMGPQQVGFKVMKKGPGGPALSKKSEKIAHFISKRINLTYIPAIRTAESADVVVSELVEKELAVVEKDAAYEDALQAVAKLQQPVLDKISSSIKETLKEFLPHVRDVRVTISQTERFRALRRACEITVDDGTPTKLARKGDGVQSLAALSLMRHASVSGGAGKNLILAIEEPESHLHPHAIHQLRGVITEIGLKHQVIMTTHCPLFVDRTNIKSNILVHHNKATPAKSVLEIREILGVRASDNLQHAEVILVVEGEEDKRALKALLAHYSPGLKSALDNGSLAIECLHGGSNLSYKLSLIHEAMCMSHSYLDHDDCGKKAAEKAKQDGLLVLADVHFTTCQGQKESEFEDMLTEELYAQLLQKGYGVSTLHPKFKGNGKWSDRTRETFLQQGKAWSDQTEAEVKAKVAELVEANPGAALNQHKRNSFDALVAALEEKLKAVAESKK